MTPLELQLTVVTPAFIGGAEPNARAELRPPSIKGHLRFWHRAVNPEYRKLEPVVFGSADGGQSPFGLAVTEDVTDTQTWNNASLRTSRPGLAYLGYTFDLGENDRKYLLPRGAVGMRVIPRARWAARPSSENEQEQLLRCQRAWVASLWLWQTFGGVGSRANRGFGSVGLEWPADVPASEGLQLRPAADAGTWKAAVEQNVARFRQWFGTWAGNADHPRLDAFCRVAIGKQPYRTWEEALSDAGTVMRTGFTGNGRYKRQPDYTDVKAHLVAHGASGPQSPAPKKLSQAPERAAFGLPLAFRYGSLHSPQNRALFEPEGADRWPSRLRLSVARLVDGLHVVYCLLSAPTPAGVRVRVGSGASSTLAPPDLSVLGEFMDYVSDPIRGVKVL